MTEKIDQLPGKTSHEKKGLHPRNPHCFPYDFEKLSEGCPELKSFISLNAFGKESVDFFNPDAVKTLNKALLYYFYDIKHWEIPENYLYPPIPSRADYIHYMADLLCESNEGIIPTGKAISVLDIGVGANCVYPLIGHKAYGWTFVGSDIDPMAIQSTNNIITWNSHLKKSISCRLQHTPTYIFKNIVNATESFDFTICNPPFHSSLAEAQIGTLRKLTNLKSKKTNNKVLNFGGQHAELWCKGGEAEFIRLMIEESKQISTQCFWFTSLVSKKESLPSIYYHLKKANVFSFKTIAMRAGQKTSRIVTWTFLNETQQKEWKIKRWS